MEHFDELYDINSRLINSPIESHRVLAAQSAGLIVEQQMALAQDDSLRVKLALAGNPDLDKQTLSYFAEYEQNPDIRELVRVHPRTPEPVADKLNEEYNEKLVEVFQRIYEDRFIPNAGDLVDSLDQKPERGNIASLNAHTRAAGYRYILENANTDKAKRDALDLVKKDSCPEIRNLYKEYTGKYPELAKDPEKEKEQEKAQEKEQKRGIRKALDI